MDKMKLRANLLFGVTTLFWFAQYAYMPYVNPELTRMGAAATLIGFIGGSYGFTQMLLRIPLGLWTDRLGKKHCISAGCLLSALSSFSAVILYNPAGFLLCRALAGVASSTWVAFTILYSTYFPPERSTGSITMLNVGNQIGRLAAFLLIGFVVSRLGVKSAFVISGLVGIAAFFGSLWLEDQPAQKKPVSLADMKEVVRDPNLLVTSALAILSQLITFATMQSFAANHAASAGLRMEQLSYMNIFILAPIVASGYITSKFLLKYIRANALLVTGFLLTAVYCVVLPFTVNAMQIYLIHILAGVGNSFTFNLLLGLCVEDIPLEKRSAAMGFFQAVYGIGMTIGPVLMGWMVDLYSLRTGFLVIAALSAATALCAAVFYGIVRRTPRL